MTGEVGELKVTAEGDTNKTIVRPALVFKEVTFSDGATLAFADDEIVVFVGPNNAGKSATLREMEALVLRNGAHTVIKGATLHKTGNRDDLEAYLEKNSQKVSQSHDLRYTGLGFDIHKSHLQYFDNASDRHPVAPFFFTRLATENRITASNAAGAIALYQQPPNHPIHLLLMDEKLADRISAHFHHAFGKDLFPFRAGGGNFPLYVGRKPETAAGEDELSKSFVDKIREQAEPLESQGDGMRSFATVLLYVLVADTHSIQFLDEPEAFLHPPQARLLGELIARERKAKAQLFIATHSTDVLEGLITGGASKVRIVRLHRDGAVNRVKELSKEKTAAIANDTLARYSGVFGGIFYQHVVICESDSDCLFYSSLLNTKAVSGDQRADILFIHTSGKHRMGQLAETLRELDVPVSVIADVDLFSEESTFRTLLERLGGNWTQVQSRWRSLKTAVEERKPPLNAEQVSAMIRKELEGADGTKPFPKDKEQAIKRVFKTVSPWDNVKRSGRADLPQGQAVQHFDELLRSCAEIGLWVLPVGELEGFCRSIDGGHGPGFVEKVLEERNLETDRELAEARQFIRSVLGRARPFTNNVEGSGAAVE
jgi:ABC-type transporter Mla maintaining outer membrane lipid asymmetry ATPase subunit MlaF